MSLFWLLIAVPFWIAFLPAAIVQHRIGVLLHEYIHGIPFRRYRANLRVLSFFDGLLLVFGLMELFRTTHLAHHRWLNAEGDPAFVAARENTRSRWGRAGALEGIQHLLYLAQSVRGKHPYASPSRMVLGLCQSVLWVMFWVALDRADVAWKLVALTIYNTLVPISFRGAVEHHSHKEDEGFANEYRVLIPLFNLNKHIHHHRDPRLPWYLLRYQTERPLWTLHYFTHWFRVYLTGEYVLMQPLRKITITEEHR